MELRNGKRTREREGKKEIEFTENVSFHRRQTTPVRIRLVQRPSSYCPEVYINGNILCDHDNSHHIIDNYLLTCTCHALIHHLYSRINDANRLREQLDSRIVELERELQAQKELFDHYVQGSARWPNVPSLLSSVDVKQGVKRKPVDEIE